MFALSAGMASANLLSNPGFETPSGFGNTVLVGSDLSGNSAAQDWLMWNNTNAVSSTGLYTPPPGLAGSGTYSILVTTSGDDNGIYQTFLPGNTGPNSAIGSVWVYVLQGSVGMGTGNGGDTLLDTTTSVHDQWVQLSAPNGVSPANEFIVYSASAGGATFYVDNADVEAVPEPAAWAGLALGAVALVRRRAKRSAA